jgi:hypothetical protein
MEKYPCPFPVITLPLIMMNLDLSGGYTHSARVSSDGHASDRTPLSGAMLATFQLIP